MLQNTINIAKKYVSAWLLVAIFVENILLAFVDSYLMVLIAGGASNVIPILLLLNLMCPITSNYIIKPHLQILATDIKHDFESNGLKKYTSMSFENKNSKPSTLFYEKNQAAGRSLYLLVEWGLPNFMNLVGVICSVVWVFIQKRLLLELLTALVVCVLVYIFVIRNKQNNFTKLDKEIKKVSQRIRSKIQLDLIPFQYKECTAERIIKQLKVIEDNDNIIDLEWNKIIGLTCTSNQYVAVMMSYLASNDIPSFMLIMLTMNNLSNAITNCTYFTTQYNRIYNDYSNLEEFWSGAVFKDDVRKLQPTVDLRVVNVRVQRPKSNFIVALSPDINISLKPGEKIYIHGPSASGKSTLVKAILGQIKGAHLNIGKPKNYYHNVVNYFQEIKEKMPSSKITIRDYFKGQKDNNIIEKYLLRVFESNELCRMKETFLSSDDVNTNGETNAYDIELNERISGGQKSRIILTLRGYEADMANKSIIVLDEPCPDVDHDTYTKNMNRFFDCYKNHTIIMIAHLCKCKKDSLNIAWSQEYVVNNGLVARAIS